MAPLALAFLAASLGLNVMGDRRVEKASRGVLRDGMRTQQGLQRDINTEVIDTAKKVYDPTARGQRYEQTATDRENSLGAAMREVDSAPAVDANGQLSTDYLMAKAARTAEQADAVAKLTRLVARAGTGDQVRTADSLTSLGSADRVAGIGQRMRQEQDLMDTRMAHAQHAGDNQKLLGQIFSMAGLMSGGGKAGGGTAAAAAPAPTVKSTGMFIFPNR